MRLLLLSTLFLAASAANGRAGELDKETSKSLPAAAIAGAAPAAGATEMDKESPQQAWRGRAGWGFWGPSPYFGFAAPVRFGFAPAFGFGFPVNRFGWGGWGWNSWGWNSFGGFYGAWGVRPFVPVWGCGAW